MCIVDFVRQSNRIEGILREPNTMEVNALLNFVALDVMEIRHLVEFVSFTVPHAVLRDEPGLNVRVGNHIAPAGGPSIRDTLNTMLSDQRSPWQQHIDYETLHPFTDGNGRSGRALWLWRMGGNAPLGFLHTFYYQTLENT